MSLVLLPDDISHHVLCNLSPKDLAQVSQVSKRLNRLLKNENFWKSYCLKYLESPNPYKESWVERYKIINNWRKASFNSTSIKSKTKRLEECIYMPISNFIYEEDLYLVSFAKSEFINHKLCIENLSTSHLSMFNFNVSCHTIQDGRLGVIDENGAVHLCELKTGGLLKNFRADYFKTNDTSFDKKIKQSKILMYDQKIVIYYDHAIHFIDIETEAAKNTVTIEDLKRDDMVHIVQSKNFIIYCKLEPIFDRHIYQKILGVINKESYEKSSWAEPKSYDVILASDHYLVCSYQSEAENTSVDIFEDRGDELKLLHNLNLSRVFGNQPLDRKNELCIYLNWLIYKSNKTILVWDLKINEEVSRFHVFDAHFSYLSSDGNVLYKIGCQILDYPLTESLFSNNLPFKIKATAYSFLPKEEKILTNKVSRFFSNIIGLFKL